MAIDQIKKITTHRENKSSNSDVKNEHHPTNNSDPHKA
jgi:hypothetical protein